MNNINRKKSDNSQNYNIATMTAWKQALEKVADMAGLELSSSKNANDHKVDYELDGLPVFAIITVIKTSGLATTQQADIRNAIVEWVDEQSDTPAGWQAVSVDEFDKADNNFVQSTLQHVDVAGDRLTDVMVFRYVLCPSSQKLLQGVSDTKKTAIAHVIDEQLSEQLSQYLQQNGYLGDDEEGVGFDCHILPISNLLKVHKVACFDMDSTLIEQEVIVELAKATGIGNKVNEITESAMRGEIDFSESFSQRLGLLHGTYAEVLDDITETLTLSAGAKSTLTMLNAMGYHTVLVSGGFVFFARVIADKLDIAEFHANELLISEGKVIGEVQPPLVDGARKAELVKMIAKQQGVQLSDVICIGDGANDLAMMAEANLGFAYRAKPIVQAKADLAINVTGLEGVLYGLGYRAIAKA